MSAECGLIFVVPEAARFLLFCVGVLTFGIWHGMREDRKLHHGVTRN